VWSSNMRDKWSPTHVGGLPYLADRVRLVAHLAVLAEVAIRVVDVVARELAHLVLPAVGPKAAVGLVGDARVVDEPIVFAVAPAVRDVSIDVAEVAVVVAWGRELGTTSDCKDPSASNTHGHL